MDPLNLFYGAADSESSWVAVPSELKDISGGNQEIKIRLGRDGRPKAMAFFDIDGTLAHLEEIHGQAIAAMFPDQEPGELKETYYRGFRLGNSFREFDRMRGIYIDGRDEWRDPEVYLKNRLNYHRKEIDEPGYQAHEIAAGILRAYGETAAGVAEDMYRKNPEKLEKAGMVPIFVLAKICSGLGIPMVGFTANAKVLVGKLAMYLKLSDIFLDIATDETMAGGGKEIAIESLIKKMRDKGLKVPENRLLFVGDSIRGDIGVMLKAREKDHEVNGQGILVLKDKQALIEIRKEVNSDPELQSLTESMEIYAFLTEAVPQDEKGNPMLLSRFESRFLIKL